MFSKKGLPKMTYFNSSAIGDSKILHDWVPSVKYVNGSINVSGWRTTVTSSKTKIRSVSLGPRISQLSLLTNPSKPKKLDLAIVGSYFRILSFIPSNYV